jgi:DNA-binding response OmpR family regulator
MADLRILIVEDNLTLAINLEAHFVEWGYEVLGIINSSEDALEFIEDAKPDVVLMDINIKGEMNGIEVTKAISHLNIFFVYITAERNQETYDLAAATKGVSYLVKPFDMLTLRGTIELCIPHLRE